MVQLRDMGDRIENDMIIVILSPKTHYMWRLINKIIIKTIRQISFFSFDDQNLSWGKNEFSKVLPYFFANIFQVPDPPSPRFLYVLVKITVSSNLRQHAP